MHIQCYDNNRFKLILQELIIPANPNDYDVERAFGYYDTIDWKRSYNYENGDILFIYVSGNVKKVRYKVEVIEGLVQDSHIIYDNTFWLDEEKYEQSLEYERSRVRLVDEADTPDLSLAKLREQGLKGNIQGAMKLSGESCVIISCLSLNII
jgi:5-methylcytosine-specific restriction protein A